MFNVELKLMVGGHEVGISGFLETFLAEIRKAVRSEAQGLPQTGTPMAGILSRVAAEEQKRPKRLAVGINEAAKMIGVSHCALRLYAARGAIRTTRVGRRLLVPMEVLEKIMVEGIRQKNA